MFLMKNVIFGKEKFWEKSGNLGFIGKIAISFWKIILLVGSALVFWNAFAQFLEIFILKHSIIYIQFQIPKPV